METCETCQEVYQLGLLPEDSLASLSVLPGSKAAQAMTVGSGRKWLELLSESDQLGYLVKMCLGSSAWNSTRCFLTWNVSATPHGRLLFRLSASMPRTEENGFGLWATPSAADSQGTTGDDLATAVNRAMFPTPTTQDASNNGGASQMNRNTPPLNAVVGGSLNPTWVEWLMGYPKNWTEVD